MEKKSVGEKKGGLLCVECLWKIEEEKMKEIKKKKERLCLERKEKGKWRKEREKEM